MRRQDDGAGGEHNLASDAGARVPVPACEYGARCSKRRQWAELMRRAFGYASELPVATRPRDFAVAVISKRLAKKASMPTQQLSGHSLAQQTKTVGA